MAIKNIITEPNKILRQISQPVESVGKEEKKQMDDMIETMYANNGVGLAATQVGLDKRIFVMDVSGSANTPLCFINPEIIAKNDETRKGEEGCLSVPGFSAEVERATWVKVKALNKQGKIFELEAEGLMAVCIQHELDHLEGKLFIDYLSHLKRKRLEKILEKQKRAANR